MKTQCPHCAKQFQTNEAYVGKRTICKGCGQKFEITDMEAKDAVAPQGGGDVFAMFAQAESSSVAVETAPPARPLAGAVPPLPLPGSVPGRDQPPPVQPVWLNQDMSAGQKRAGRENHSELKGLRGWLILVGIGVVFSPIRLLVIFVPLYLSIFSGDTWRLLTTAGSKVYNPLWGPLLIGEIVFNSCLFAVSVYMVYLFFSRHYRFPKVYIGVLIVSLCFIPLDAWMTSIVQPNAPMFDADTTKEFARTLIAVLIWVPYMLRSKRVEATFVEKRPGWR